MLAVVEAEAVGLSRRQQLHAARGAVEVERRVHRRGGSGRRGRIMLPSRGKKWPIVRLDLDLLDLLDLLKENRRARNTSNNAWLQHG